MQPRGLIAEEFGARAEVAPTSAPEAKAPLAKPAAPVALQQSRILGTTRKSRLQILHYQFIATSTCKNPVLFRLPVRF